MSTNKWTDEEISIIKNNYFKMSVTELLKLLPNRSYYSIRSWVTSNGLRKGKNKRINQFIRINDDISKIIIHDKHLNTYDFIIDSNELERCMAYNWCLKSNNGSMYARCKNYYLHRFIMQETNSDVDIDHIDCNTLNNIKVNLRCSNKSENNQNRTKLNKNNKTGFRGVSYHKKYKKYCGRVMFNNVYVFIHTDSDLNYLGKITSFARAYILPFSSDAREIRQEDIPQWIKDKIDKKLKNRGITNE